MPNHQVSFRSLRSSLPFFVLIAVALVTTGTNMFLASQLPLILRNSSLQHQPFDRLLVLSGDASSDRTIHRTENDHDGILHIVTTRFMQHQSELLELGWARMALFETFCLPTMIRQQANNFIWFVMTDPNLHADLLQRLRTLLSPYPHFYLVSSNTMVVVPQNLTAGSPKRDNFILTGDLDTLSMKMFDFHRPLLLETRLDADDGLHETTLLEIQTVARQLPVDSRGWQIICAGLHYEWRNDAIGAIAAFDGEGKTNQDKHHITSGKLRVVKEGICVTPGYTLVRHRNDESIEFPPRLRKGHQEITRDWPECNVPVDGSNLVNVTTSNSLSSTGGSINDVPTYNCWKKLGLYPAALRPRTITSAGMSRIGSGRNSFFDNQTEKFWGLVQRDFGIQPDQALSTSRYLHEHFLEIVADNLKGQW